MNKEVLSIINEEFEMVPESFGGEKEIYEVRKAEDILGTKLPKDYVEFICMFGCGVVGTTVILGLGEAQFVSTPSFVEETLKFRRELSSKYEKIVIIGVDGAGNPIGFNSPNEEIILYDHNLGEKVFIASNFSEYLKKACYDEINIQF